MAEVTERKTHVDHYLPVECAGGDRDFGTDIRKRSGFGTPSEEVACGGEVVLIRLNMLRITTSKDMSGRS